MPDSARFPEIDSSPRLGGTSTALSRMVDKTIASVEFGDEKPDSGTPEGEAIIIHFTDGSSIAIVAGPHGRDLAGKSQAETGGAGIDLAAIWQDESEREAFDDVMGM